MTAFQSLTYLQSYANEFNLLKHIRFNTRLDEALWGDNSWKVQLSNGAMHRFDKVVIANGNYGVLWHSSVPHHPWFTLVIGNGPSGQTSNCLG